MNREEKVSCALRSVLDLYRNRIDLLRSADRPKIGYLSIDTPEEILLAAGAVPFRLTGELETSPDDACARLSTNYCSYVLSCLSEALAGVYDFVDTVIFTDSCDMRKRLSEAWTRYVPSSAYFLELPNDASDISKEYFADRLRRLIEHLECRYKRKIGEEALRESIQVYNQSRRLMQRLYEFKKGRCQVLTGDESIQIVKAATTGLKEHFNEAMSNLLEALETAAPPPSRKRPRVMICGGYFDHAGIVEIIEQAGADLVCEDISNGIKYFEGQIETEAEPVTAIANYYLERNTSARRLETNIRIRHILDLAGEYRVDSVIYFSLKFCDTNLHDYPYVLEKLREAKVPVLFLEGERNGENIAGTKTRIQTFLESRIW